MARFTVIFLAVIYTILAPACGGGVSSINLQTASSDQTDDDHVTHSTSPVLLFWEGVIKRQFTSAESVVRGKVKSINTERHTNDHGDRFVVSIVTLEVIETIKGDVHNQIEFETLGGVIGDHVYSYSIAPEFASGEEVVVFLIRHREKFVVPFGWEASKLIVRDDQALLPGAFTMSTLKKWVGGGGDK